MTSLKRSLAAPEVPAVAETVKGFEAIGWYGIVAPRRTPAPIVERVAAAVMKGMQAPDVKQRVAGDGSEAVGSSPQAFAAFLASEMARFSKVIKDTGIKPE